MRTWRPNEQRRIVRDLLILTILFWATQTLLAQWGFAAEVEAQEKFVPSGFSRAVRVVIGESAAVAGPDVRLKDIAQWSEADEAAMQEAAELVVRRFAADGRSETVDVREVKRILSDAGVNLGLISFSGSMICRITREKRMEEGAPIDPLLASNLPADIDTVLHAGLPDAAEATPPPSRPTLREAIIQQLSAHLGLPVERLHVRFEAKDEKLTALREGAYQFHIAPQKTKRLGHIAWDVTISNAGSKKRHLLMTRVQAWQMQLVAARPLSVKQVIQHDDVAEKRVLVDYLSDEAPLTRQQIVGQQSGRDIPIGTVITPRVIHAVQLVRVGQLVTVIVENGGIHVKWVAEARENGNFGQVIRVRKPGTRQEFTVIVTGPEQTKLSGGGAVDVTADARR